MYRYLAKQFAPAPPEQLFLVHPLQLSRWLEVAWAAAPNVPALGGGSGQPLGQLLGSPTVIADFDLPEALLRTLEPGIVLTDPGGFDGSNSSTDRHTAPLLWDHFIYAYLLECTGILEILARILSRMVRGQTLGRLRPETLQWARATEDLFFRDPPPFSIIGVMSQVRGSTQDARWSAYYQMFGSHVPHRPAASSTDSGVGNSANTMFVPRLNELLGQIWVGYENRINSSGANATDPQYVGLLCEAIDDMLGNRRQGGRLAREEFASAALMSWCHLTVESDTPLIQDLQATATSPAERLAKLGERVGLTPAPHARELFELAEPMSAFLWGIELGLFNPGGAPESLYLPNTPNGPPTPLNIEVNRIIDLWQSATGTRIKTPGAATTVGAPRPSAQPLRVPTPGPVPTAPAMVTPTANGRRADVVR